MVQHVAIGPHGKNSVDTYNCALSTYGNVAVWAQGADFFVRVGRL